MELGHPSMLCPSLRSKHEANSIVAAAYQEVLFSSREPVVARVERLVSQGSLQHCLSLCSGGPLLQHFMGHVEESAWKSSRSVAGGKPVFSWELFPRREAALFSNCKGHTPSQPP